MDITYIQYSSMTKYLSNIIDLFNNETFVYKLYDHQQTSLVIDTLKLVLENPNHPNGSPFIRTKEVPIRHTPFKNSLRGTI